MGAFMSKFDHNIGVQTPIFSPIIVIITLAPGFAELGRKKSKIFILILVFVDNFFHITHVHSMLHRYICGWLLFGEYFGAILLVGR
jgi:hypothetical protein